MLILQVFGFLLKCWRFLRPEICCKNLAPVCTNSLRVNLVSSCPFPSSRRFQEPVNSGQCGLAVITLATCFWLCSCCSKETAHKSTLSDCSDSYVLLHTPPRSVGETRASRARGQHCAFLFLRDRVWRRGWVKGLSFLHSPLAGHLLTGTFRTEHVHTGLLIPLAHLPFHAFPRLRKRQTQLAVAPTSWSGPLSSHQISIVAEERAQVFVHLKPPLHGPAAQTCPGCVHLACDSSLTCPPPPQGGDQRT